MTSSAFRRQPEPTLEEAQALMAANAAKTMARIEILRAEGALPPAKPTKSKVTPVSSPFSGPTLLKHLANEAGASAFRPKSKRHPYGSEVHVPRQGIKGLVRKSIANDDGTWTYRVSFANGRGNGGRFTQDFHESDLRFPE